MSTLTSKRQFTRNSYIPSRRGGQSQTRKPEVTGNAYGNTAHNKTDILAHDLTGQMEISIASVKRAVLWLLGLSLVLGVFFGLIFGLPAIYNQLTNSSFFYVDEITVIGANYLDQEEIIEICGLRLGQNSLRTNIPEMEQMILQNPWVKNISIRRQLPNQFIIEIEERVPFFWLLRNNALYYLDSGGLLIAPVENNRFRSLPTLEVGPGGEDGLEVLSQFMETIKFAKMPFDLSQISWLRLSAAKGFEIYWEARQLSLSISLENWRENLRRLCLVIQDMEMRNEIKFTREIRAADGQVWLQKV